MIFIIRKDRLWFVSLQKNDGRRLSHPAFHPVHLLHQFPFLFGCGIPEPNFYPGGVIIVPIAFVDSEFLMVNQAGER